MPRFDSTECDKLPTQVLCPADWLIADARAHAERVMQIEAQTAEPNVRAAVHVTPPLEL